MKENDNKNDKNKPELPGERSAVPKPIESILLHDNPYRIVKSDKYLPDFSLKITPLTLEQKILTQPCNKAYRDDKNICLKTNEKLLNLIIPPKSTFIGREMFVQNVSSCPGKDLDVIHLQTKLNDLLKLKGAKTTGICSTRRRLFDDMFQEIIRQVTIECMERGLLLSRINHELDMSLRCTQTIYESGIGYGMNKSLQSASQHQLYDKRVDILNEEIEILKNKLHDANENVNMTEEKERSKYLSLKKKCDIDFNFMKKNYEQLRIQLIEAIDSIKNPEIVNNFN